jgi:glucose-fructose oxidoreductase
MTGQRFTRRMLLKTAATTAVSAVALPYLIPSTALGDEKKAAPSERVTLGHIGVGNRGRDLFRGFQQCETAQSVAVADCYASRREAIAGECGGKAYADFREILADPKIDAVVVATPDHWHVPIAMAAAKVKKHAYVEKPLAVSVEQNLACRKIFQENKLAFQYGTQQRSMAHCRFGCELVRSGKLGKLESIEVACHDGAAGGSKKEAPVPPGFDFEMWTGPAPQAPYALGRCEPCGTYWIYDYSIGYLGGWGAHPLDIMVWACESDLAGPYEIEGTGVIPKEGLYDTVYHWDMKGRFADGVKFAFTPIDGDLTKFIGSEGWLAISRGGLDAEPKSLLQLKLGPGDAHLPESIRHDQNFLDAIRGSGKAISSVADAARSDIISQLCDIAVRTGRKITWDPRAETILGDAEAAKLMHREMRAPWTL